MGEWAGVLRLFNLFQFLKYGYFTSATGLKAKEYELLLFADNLGNRVESDEWNAIYAEVMEEAQALVKKLSKESASFPQVGYEICNDKGVVIAESELAWPELRIAVMLDDPMKVDGWELFNVEESEAIIESVKRKGEE